MSKGETIKYGGASVRCVPRSDGRWHLRWRVGGQEKTTTAKSREAAIARAREIAKDLSRSTGSRMVAQIDAAVFDQVAALAAREGVSPAAWVARAESLIDQAGGSWAAVEQAVQYWNKIGVAKVTRVNMATAISRFLEIYENHRSPHTLKGFRQEMNGWIAAGYGELGCLEVTQSLLQGWLDRGDAEITPRYYNNRLNRWRTFWAKCRQWGYWPEGVATPSQGIEKKREPDRAPEIFTPAQAWKGLELLTEKAPDLLWHYSLGCWAGLRPMELSRLHWEDLNWEQGYIRMRAEVAGKTLRERFVPMEIQVKTLRALGKPKRRLGCDSALVCGHKDASRISILFREAGILNRWQQDIMRHSYISYRIARGDSLARIAEEAGNSEGIIRRRYRRPVRESDGAQYFGAP